MACYQEMAVAIEKDIENLDCFRKFDQFITLCNYCHMNRCETGVNCRKRKFFMNLRYLYVDNLISGENVETGCCGPYFPINQILYNGQEQEGESDSGLYFEKITIVK